MKPKIHEFSNLKLRWISKALIPGIAFIICGSTLVSAQIITTVAGNGTAGFSGDGGQATAAELNWPFDVANDAAGNFYVADALNYRVRKVNAAGVISTFAGTGTSGYNGDNIAATAANLSLVTGVSTDAAGNVYIADFTNSRVRKVNAAGIITTVAGNGTFGFSGDGGQATAAGLYFPVNVTFDGAGNMYISDYVNYRVRKVTAAGIISTIAGNGTAGFSGDGGQATAAEINCVSFVATDAAGNIYLSDDQNNRIRKITAAGVISTIAGTGTGGYNGDGIQATSAEVFFSTGNGGSALDLAGNMYVGDYGNNRIRQINAAGVITTIGGNGIAGFSGDGGPATAAELKFPFGISIDGGGNIYIADEENSRIRKITGIALPVTLSSFTASYNTSENSVTTQWTAASQVNNKLFVVEKSVDSKTWTEVGTLPGAGNASVSMSYSLTDNNPMGSFLNAASIGADGVTLYYRLRQIDFDGHETSFIPAAVSVNPYQNALQLYPNPSPGKVYVTTPEGFSQNSTGTFVKVFNLSGQVVYNATIQQNNDKFTLDLSSLPSSVYIIQTIASNTTCQQRILLIH